MLDSWLRQTIKLRHSVEIGGRGAKGVPKGVPIVSKVSWYCFRLACRSSFNYEERSSKQLG